MHSIRPMFTLVTTITLGCAQELTNSSRPKAQLLACMCFKKNCRFAQLAQLNPYPIRYVVCRADQVLIRHSQTQCWFQHYLILTQTLVLTLDSLNPSQEESSHLRMVHVAYGLTSIDPFIASSRFPSS
ncbi:hypothetical protein F5878DRAFT_75247 [Lentinula raphanica]|uniref:Secreted protein n=1 Tax=Lentinula raphanica TaxID=153919 RepID=A0AA38PKJ3_9AGAR|nr:hypothetical protein F5878DRAFT_75247 [Lentinula raphanica]